MAEGLGFIMPEHKEEEWVERWKKRFDNNYDLDGKVFDVTRYQIRMFVVFFEEWYVPTEGDPDTMRKLGEGRATRDEYENTWLSFSSAWDYSLSEEEGLSEESIRYRMPYEMMWRRKPE